MELRGGWPIPLNQLLGEVSPHYVMRIGNTHSFDQVVPRNNGDAVDFAGNALNFSTSSWVLAANRSRAADPRLTTMHPAS